MLNTNVINGPKWKLFFHGQIMDFLSRIIKLDLFSLVAFHFTLGFNILQSVEKIPAIS